MFSDHRPGGAAVVGVASRTATEEACRMLGECSLFGELDAQERNVLFGRVRVRNYAAGETIFLMGSAGDSMMAVPVSTTPPFKAGRPEELWKGHYSHGMSSSCGQPGATSSNYDVTADGSRFLMIKDDDQDRAVSKQIVVALGWANEIGPMSARA